MSNIVVTIIAIISPLLTVIGLLVTGAYYAARIQSDYEATKSTTASLQSKVDTLTLSLQNLRGEKGAQGPEGKQGPKGDQGIQGPVGGMPIGLIAAFASRTCPTGWAPYEKAEGRFLLGFNGSNQDPLPLEGASGFDMINSTNVPEIATEKDQRLPLYQKSSPSRQYRRDGITIYNFFPPYTQVKFCEKNK